MKKILILSGAISLLTSGAATAQTTEMNRAPSYQLEQVLVISRHNQRTPFTWNNKTLSRATPNEWPKWSNKGNDLTTKGAALEVYMGNYISLWLQKLRFLSDKACPGKGDVLIYANRRQRTAATAQFFAASAFPTCDINVQYQPIPAESTWESMDPIFNYPITSKDPAFKELTLKAMNDKYNSLDLKESYRLLEEIVDYKNSKLCKEDKQCSLVDGKNTFGAEAGDDPTISGPLKVGNALVEALMVEYYEGFPMEKITWGKQLSPKQWQELMKLRNGYQDVQFSSPIVSQHLAKPLINYINDYIAKKDNPKMLVLVGHDTNVATLLSALQVNNYELPLQYETTPIGGKVVFQRWRHPSTQQDMLKIEYVYQSADQLRNAEVLTLDNPAKHVTLSLKNCPIDAQGFCKWSDFEAILKSIKQ